MLAITIHKIWLVCLVLQSTSLRLAPETFQNFSPPLDASKVRDETSLDDTMTLEWLLSVGHSDVTLEDLKAFDKTGLRPHLEKVIHQKKVAKTIYFIGDSLLRNQWVSYCYLITNQLLDQSVSNNNQGVQSCTGNGVTAYTSWTHVLDPAMVGKILNSGAAPPTLVYWDSAMWSGQRGSLFSDPEYTKGLNETRETYAAAAPDAKLAFFLSHATCPKSKRVTPRSMISHLNDLAVVTLKDQVDGHGESLALIDGFNLTKDRCDVSGDGVHFNQLLWNQINALFAAVA